MTCPDCTEASARLWHVFQANCKGCQARALSRGPLFHAALKAGKRTKAYRDALTTADVTHDEVLAARKTDAIHNKEGHP